MGGASSGAYQLRWRPRFAAPPLLLLTPGGYAVCFVNASSADAATVLCRAPMLGAVNEGAAGNAGRTHVETFSLATMVAAAEAPRPSAGFVYQPAAGQPAPSGFSFLAIGTGTEPVALTPEEGGGAEKTRRG
jgi:hypothetical protein